jgi:hypothetical protein
LILVSNQKYQNDFRQTSRGKTSHIDDVRGDVRTLFSDKRPLIGIKGLGRVGVQGVQELQEFTEATFGSGAAEANA